MNKFIDFDEDQQVVLPTGKSTGISAVTSATVGELNPEGVSSGTTIALGNLLASSNEEMELVTLHEMERRYIMSVLEKTNGNKSEAAKILGITIKSVYNKLHEYESTGHSLGLAAINKK